MNALASKSSASHRESQAVFPLQNADHGIFDFASGQPPALVAIRSGVGDQGRGNRTCCSTGFRFVADLYGAFPVKGFSLAVGRLIADCRLGFADSSLFGAEEAVLRPVACDQVPGARGRGQGTKR